MHKSITNKNCLYSICNEKMAMTLIKIAELYPESKDALMDAILADPRAFEGLRGRLFDLSCILFVCKAYPQHAKAIMRKITPQNYPSQALFAFKLFNQAKGNDFSYLDFVAIFPEFADNLFNMENVFAEVIRSVFAFRDSLKYLVKYRIILIDQFLRQSDAKWRDFCSDDSDFLTIAQYCPERRDAMFQRYFSIIYNNREVCLEKLLALTLKTDGYNRNRHGLDNLEELVKLFPECKSALFDRLCSDPAILHIILDLGATFSAEGRALRLFEMGFEYKDRLLATLQKLPAVPGLLGALTHGVLDLASQEDAWWHWNHFLSLTSLFPEQAKNVAERIFTNQAVLTKVLSHTALRFRRAFELAIQFPQFKQQIIDAILQEKQVVSNSRVAVEINSLYAENQFSNDVWPWLDLVIECPGENLVKLCCQLFPDYSNKFIKFCLENELFHEAFFRYSDNVIYAVMLAPDLKNKIFTSIDASRRCDEQVVDALLCAFPENIPEIIDLLLKYNLGHLGKLIDFLHRHPECQVTLVENLRSHPRKFLEILSRSQDIYALFVLFPNRRLLVETFCAGAKMSEAKLALLDDVISAISVLPEFIGYFLKYIFEIPGYADEFFRYGLQECLRALYGHERDVILVLCSYPQMINDIKFILDRYALVQDQEQLRALVDCCYSIYHDVCLNVVNLDLDIRHINRAYRGCIVKFIERLIAADSNNEETLAALQTLRNNVAYQAIPRLQFVAHAVVVQAHYDALPEEVVEDASQESVNYAPFCDRVG